MRVDTPQMDISIPDDDHRYFGFRIQMVFDASVYILEKMGLRISYSNIYQGRIIAAKGSTKEARAGHLDIKLIGRGSVTLVHVRTGSGTVSTRDDTSVLRRQFLWELSRRASPIPTVNPRGVGFPPPRRTSSAPITLITRGHALPVWFGYRQGPSSGTARGHLREPPPG